jgi:hypothetical protein
MAAQATTQRRSKKHDLLALRIFPTQAIQVERQQVGITLKSFKINEECGIH